MTPESIRVLITAVGGDLGQALVKALRLSEQRIHIVGCDSDPAGVGSAFTDAYRTVPSAKNVAPFVEAINSLCRAEKIHAVIPACEPEIAVSEPNRATPAFARRHSDRVPATALG